jgi:aldehyde dehydrogenase (NAD+)
MNDESLKLRVETVLKLQKQHALHLRTSTAAERIGWIKKLRDWVLSHRELIREAMYADYRKPFTETDISEIYPVVSEAKHTIKNLKHWMRSKRVRTPLTFWGTTAHVQYEPKGSSLIIAPWNYPFNLALCPLISAISAGCTAIVKPSEMTPHVSSLLHSMVGELFEENHVCVLEGGLEASQELLAQPFDHVFFTGSPAVGKVVMKAASEHLASVTLELGGKSPVIITKSANLKDAAIKIASTKFINCGQTCVAPDFVLIPTSIRDEFVNHLQEAIATQYVCETTAMELNPDYSRIVNERHFSRLNGLVADACAKGAVIARGGKSIPDENFIEPTILTGVSATMRVMEEEIFGPILPILDYEDLDKALESVNEMPKPLALYAFSKSAKELDFIFQKTSSGGAVANDCVLHFLHPELPFGGVNNSGIGKSHGNYGFLEFSNQKGVLKQRVGLTTASLLLPPYSKTKKMVVDVLLKYF